jgi:hypothetical protein
MLEGIRGNLMRRYQRKRDAIKAMEGNVGRKIKEKLEIEEDDAGHCWCTYAGDCLFEVESKVGVKRAQAERVQELPLPPPIVGRRAVSVWQLGPEYLQD